LERQDLNAEEYRISSNAKEMRAEVDAYFEKHLKAQWDQRNKFYMGDHWHDVTLERWQAPIVVNHCRKGHDWYLSLLTDTPSKLAVYGYGPDDYEKPVMGQDPATGVPIKGYSPVERVTKLVEQKWDELHMDNKLATALSYALIYSVGWLKPCIDRNRTFTVQTSKGPREIPDVNVHVVDPWHIRVDPSASWSANPIEAMGNAEYVYHGHFKSIRQLTRDYPKLKDKIEGLTGAKRDEFSPWAFRTVDPSTGKGVEDEWLPQANAAGTSTYTGGQWVKPGQPRSEDYYDGRRAFVWEMWMRDNSYPDGGVVARFADDLLLEFLPNPYEHKQFPFIPLVVNPIPGRLYGFGILDIIIPVQQALNKRHGQIFDILNMIKGQPLLYEEGSIDVNKLVMEPSVKIPYVRGMNKPEWMQFPSIPPEVFRSIDDYKQEIGELLGVDETIMASTMKAGVSGVAGQQNIEQAMQRIRLADKHNEAARAELGHQMLANMQQIYKHTGYELRIIGEQGHPESIFVKPDDMMGKKDFKIITFVARSMQKEAQFKKAMDMRNSAPIEQAGIPIPDADVIELSGLPNPEGLKKEVETNKGLQQQIQQLEQEVQMLQQELQQAGPPMQGPPQPGGPM
jgi:hypothetical protein